MLESPSLREFPSDARPELRSPALQSLRNVVDRFKDVDPNVIVQPLTVGVAALGQQTNVFEGDGSHPPLPTRDMFAFLPFQAAEGRYVIATYVMTYDITNPMDPMDFLVTVEGLDGINVHAKYYDPIADRDIPIDVRDRRPDGCTLRIEVVDYPRIINLDV